MRSANKAPTDHSIIGWGKYIMEEWVARTGRSGYFQACANIDERLKISIEAEKTSSTIPSHMFLWDILRQTPWWGMFFLTKNQKFKVFCKKKSILWTAIT
jgi:hypothetical protein